MAISLVITVYYLVKFLCHFLIRFRTQIDAVLASAVSATLITSMQKTQVDAFLDGAQGACDILLLVVQ